MGRQSWHQSHRVSGYCADFPMADFPMAGILWPIHAYSHSFKHRWMLMEGVDLHEVAESLLIFQ